MKIPDHVHCLQRKLALVVLEHLVEILIMAPGHHDFVQATVLLIDAVLCAVHFMVNIGVVFE